MYGTPFRFSLFFGGARRARWISEWSGRSVRHASSRRRIAAWLSLTVIGLVVLGLSGCGTIVQATAGQATTAGGLTINPSSVSFGSVAVGQSASASVSLTNGSTSTVQVSQISITGAGFQQVSADSLPVNIDPGDSYNVVVEFVPTAAGAASGQITVVNTAAGGGTVSVALSGTGTTGANQPTTLLNGLSCDYGALTGAGTDNCTVTLSGAAPSGGLAVSLASSSSSVSVPASVTVAANANSAEFKATVAAVSSAATGTLTASAGGVNETFALKLNAATRLLNASLTRVSFGSVTVDTSTQQALVLESAGTQALTINAASLTGTGFSVSGGSFPITLNPDQVVVLEVQFAPTSAGAETGQLTITSNSSSGATMEIGLAGTGTATSSSGAGAILSVNATTVAFGTVSLNTPATQSVTLSSTGSSAVTVSGATVSGTGFTLASGSFPITLNPGQSAVLSVVFNPASAGAATGQLSIASNSTTGATTAVALTGTGASTATYAVDLTWNAPTSSSDAVVGYHIYRATGTGGSFQLLNTSVNVPTTYADATPQSGQTYVYAVTSVDASGVESADSNLFTVTIP
ncbi:MAG: choice-of-anchor D domain-containing protein [Acidobacteriaceae bacterium]